MPGSVLVQMAPPTTLWAPEQISPVSTHCQLSINKFQVGCLFKVSVSWPWGRLAQSGRDSESGNSWPTGDHRTAGARSGLGVSPASVPGPTRILAAPTALKLQAGPGRRAKLPRPLSRSEPRSLRAAEPHWQGGQARL